MGVLTEDGNEEAGRKGFLNQSLCHGYYRTSFFAVIHTLVYQPQHQIFGSNTGLYTWAHNT